MNPVRYLLILTGIFHPCWHGFLNAADEGFFKSDDTLSIVVEVPLAKLERQRGPDPEWMPGMVHVTDLDGAKQSFDVQVRARGDFRRDKEICSFPPYMLNFKKSQVKGTILSGLDKVKVVTHCRDRPKSFKGYIYKEYLAYKTYNLLTDNSFRVRLLSVHYVNPGKRPRGDPQVAFIIESVDALADRHHGKEIEAIFALPSAFDQQALSMASLYQFFLGNTDFSFINGEDDCCHNAKVIHTKSGLIPVPYDFDLTGLVDVPYGVVNSKFPIDSLDERYFRGIEVSDTVFKETLDRFLNNKENILKLWSESEYLSDREKHNALRFINEFYEIIENPERLQSEIVGRMRNADKLEASLIKLYGESK